MALKFTLLSQIQMLGEFEWVEFILVVADKQGLVCLRKGDGSNGSCKCFEVGDKFPLFQRYQKYVFLEGHTE